MSNEVDTYFYQARIATLESEVAALRAQLAQPKGAICTRCGVDRTKEPCPAVDKLICSMSGDAARKEQSK